MQQQTTTQTVREKLGLTRQGQINSNSLVCDGDSPEIYVEVLDNEFHESTTKRGVQQFHLNVKNLETGKNTELWVGGQLRFQFEKFMENGDTLKGKKFEILYKGVTPLMDPDTGAIRQVNQYKVFLLA